MSDIRQIILIVEDNDDDVFALKRALRKAGIANPLHVAVQGQEAIDYLAGQGKYSDRSQFPLPFLVFLDLKMPFVGGFEVLKWIRQQPALSDIVVVILTGSDEVRDHQQAYSLGARSYLVKPPQIADIQLLMQSMESCWLRSSDKGPVVMSQPLV